MKIPKISTINTTLNKCFNRVENKLFPNSRFKFTESSDIFCKESYSDKIERNFSANCNFASQEMAKILLQQKRPFTQQEYQKLSPSIVDAVRNRIPLSVFETAEIITDNAKIIKNIFDNKYGKDNYVFISVGRSLSATAKCLEFMNVESKSIPFSGVHSIVESPDLKTIINQEGFNEYAKYLREQCSGYKDKKLVFSDYCSSGRTLKTFKNIIESSEVGLKSKNNSFININKVLTKICSNNPGLNSKVYIFIDSLLAQRFDEIASVGKLNVRRLKLVNNALEPDKLEKSRKLQFCMLDILNSGKKYENKTNFEEFDIYSKNH